MSDTLLRVEDLKIYYPVAGSGFGKKEFVKAVDGVTFEVKKGEVFGIVGESGCGKSTLGRGVCKLENLTSGHVYLDGEDITEYNDRRMRSIRKKVQMVFQDPYASLNPRMSVFDIIAEPLLVHHLYQDKADLEKKVLDLLHRVGLDDYHANRYPHEFSGGQRQRIGIARALAVEPSLIIADEPVSALDVSIQAQVLDMVGVENAVVVEDVSNKGGGNIISLEQLYNFDPDVILFADGSIYDTVADDSAWSQLTAISTGKYYEVPGSPYSWLSGPPSMNMILGVWWLGNLIYPEVYDYDMAEMTQELYKTLWGYELSSEEVTALLGNSTLKAAAQ